MRRRQFLMMVSGATGASLLGMDRASAQSLAGQQIRVIVPFSGGRTD